jgi:hypothetical protein
LTCWCSSIDSSASIAPVVELQADQRVDELLLDGGVHG